MLETLSSIKTLEQAASDGFQVGEHSEAQGGWCTPTPHGLLLRIFVDFALCISIWLFTCLLCKDTKVNAFFVDVSNVSYWVLWATGGNYWTLGEFHGNSKFKACWSEIYEIWDLWLASALGIVLWDWDLHQLPVFNVKNDLNCWISSYCLKNQRFGCWCWETPHRPVHHAHLLEQDTRNLICFTNFLMWTVLAPNWISLLFFFF